MPRENQLEGLLRLAWRYCQRDIQDVLLMVIGMFIFLCVFGLFLVLNVAQFQPLVDTPDINIDGTQLSIVVLSAMIALANTVSTLLFLAIIVCLFEYTLAFCIVAYHYDNESWEVVNGFKRLCSDIISHLKSNEDINSKISETNKVKLQQAIATLKTEIK